MKTLKITLSLMLIALVAYAAKSTWSFDKAHSKIKFEVEHMKLSEVSGEFKEYEGTIKADKNNWEDAEVMVSIDVNSIDTDNEKRDNHLRSEDFFNAEEHPRMTFKSTEIKKVGDKKYKMTGDLTIRGTTKKETLDATLNGVIQDPWGNTRAGWTLNGKINRFDYGLKWNQTLEAGGLVVGEEVEIICDIELVKQ